MLRIALLTLPLLFASYSSHASNLSTELVASGLQVPWGIAFTSNTTALVTERNGNIVAVDLDDKTKTVALPAPSDAQQGGQGGLMDISPSPFKENEFYITYSSRVGGAYETTLASTTLSNGKLTNWTKLLTTVSGSDSGRHFGSRLAFDKESIFMTIGDRGERSNGQDKSTHAGSILRLTPEGIPFPNNPFIEDSNALPEIWSYGHRNPQGIIYDEESESLWSIEHGPRGGDEINLIKRGLNYGWPITSHGKEYWGPIDVGEAEELPGIESPRLVYVPSIAPSDLELYRGQRYPSLAGKLLAPALKLTHINVVSIDEQGQLKEEYRLFDDLNERIRTLTLSPDGFLYFATDNGNIYKIVN
ncbi:PQQ-dependent sugar dehydrogenase [Vibrio mexicanus]|uniref:PQQ-dependent sugar dehydrogenase n=1 Tax=Vibrio mexicanus TaxID=1004326 RepID=UPI00063C7D16|nr:PQQ-dependent sugar dehydrogenase [Vibrio mexicanus]